jgi:Zn-dependent alcohol dehydrogenase
MRSRAAILYEYGCPWSVEEFELDPPRAGEVLIQLAAAGLCHSDEHIRQGRLVPPPETLRSLGLPAMSPTIGGHEGSYEATLGAAKKLIKGTLFGRGKR